jgi:hypothetical protein
MRVRTKKLIHDASYIEEVSLVSGDTFHFTVGMEFRSVKRDMSFTLNATQSIREVRIDFVRTNTLDSGEPAAGAIFSDAVSGEFLDMDIVKLL